jgi:hypothetical protein
MAGLFATKSVDAFHADLKSGGSLKRALGAFDLVMLGIGCIIGTGIFVLTGVAAVNHAGPAVSASYAIAGAVCILAALCYSEFATMIPISGSAYSYAYATLGELVAWIIGWDLVLEYALAGGSRGRGLQSARGARSARDHDAARDRHPRERDHERGNRDDQAVRGAVRDRRRLLLCEP